MKKRYIKNPKKYEVLMILTILTLFNCLGVEGATAISNCAELQNIQNNLAGNYYLTQNIYCNVAPYNVTPGFNPIGPFAGSFDGQNKVINGLFINQSGVDYRGLFSSSSGQIKNIGLTDLNVIAHNYVGGLTGLNTGTISNSFVIGKVEGQFNVGGLTGRNEGSINNSYSISKVNGADYVGGLTGLNYWGSRITNSFSTSNVEGYSAVGGLTGENHGGLINTSFATGSTNTLSQGGAGLVGKNIGGTIKNSFATGSVSGDYIAGLVAYNTGTISKSSYNDHAANPDVCILDGGGDCTIISDDENTLFSSYGRESFFCFIPGFTFGNLCNNQQGLCAGSTNQCLAADKVRISQRIWSGALTQGIGHVFTDRMGEAGDNFYVPVRNTYIISTNGDPITQIYVFKQFSATSDITNYVSYSTTTLTLDPGYYSFVAVSGDRYVSYPFWISGGKEWKCDYSSIPNYQKVETSCDGLDNDCDGIRDEGCLDSDADGIPDAIDSDDDNDAILDEIDKCPYEKGDSSCYGCPESKCINLLYYNKNFHTCNIPVSDIPDLSSSNAVVDSHCNALGNHYCDIDNKWKVKTNQDGTQHTDPTGKYGCCAETMCWNSNVGVCIAGKISSEINSSDTKQFTGNLNHACILNITGQAEWKPVQQKYKWNGLAEGYVLPGQCYYSDEIHVNNGSFVNENGETEKGDYYCNNGMWTTRTKFIALKLLKYAKTNSPNNYTLYCDNYTNVLNYFNETWDEPRLATTNNICGLKDKDGNILLGFSSNVDLGQESILNSLPEVPAGKCNLNSADFSKCNDYSWYNGKTDSLIYSKQGVNLDPGTFTNMWARFKSFLFGQPASRTYVEDSALFDRLYIRKLGSKEIKASIRTEGKSKIMEIRYDHLGFNVSQIIKKGSGLKLEYKRSGTSQALKNENLAESNEYWQALTSGIRLR